LEEPATCGQGLAHHATLPAKFEQVTSRVAQMLEVHVGALDGDDPNTRAERETYLELAAIHRRIGAELGALAERMEGLRDLPMGTHDVKVLLSKPALEAFEDLTRAERELKELLEGRLEEHQKMLIEMVAKA
jgi:hypothetical protein